MWACRCRVRRGRAVVGDCCCWWCREQCETRESIADCRCGGAEVRKADNMSHVIGGRVFDSVCFRSSPGAPGGTCRCCSEPHMSAAPYQRCHRLIVPLPISSISVIIIHLLRLISHYSLALYPSLTFTTFLSTLLGAHVLNPLPTSFTHPLPWPTALTRQASDQSPRCPPHPSQAPHASLARCPHLHRLQTEQTAM